MRHLRFEENFNSFSLSVRSGEYYRFDYSKISNQVHYHDCYELVYVLDGRGTFRFGETERLLHEGGLFISGPMEPHEIHIRSRETMTLIYLMFKIEKKNRNPLLLSPEEEIISRFLLSHRTCRDRELKLRSYISFFENYASAGGNPADSWFRACLKNFLLQSLDTLAHGGKPDIGGPVVEESLMEKALDYIDRNLSARVTADDIARSINTSKRNLYRLFGKNLGRSVHDYIKEKKIAMAENYLHMNFSVSETAGLVGMENLSQFSRTFKQYEGISPMEYKRRFCHHPGGYGRRYKIPEGL